MAAKSPPSKAGASMEKIHATAIVEDGAVLGSDVEIGPHAVVGSNVVLGDGCKVFGHAMISGHTKLGERCEVYPFAHIGGKTQDLKYAGGTTYVEIGARTVLRECVTVNSGTRDGEVTKIGADCLLMAYCHVAHGCNIGDHLIVSNGTSFAGEVLTEEHVTVSGLCGVHQFCRIGCHAMIGPSTIILQDAPPYMITMGAEVKGVNIVGLTRRGFSEEARDAIKSAYKAIYRSGLHTTDAIDKIASKLPRTPELEHLVDFSKTSQRGVIR